MRTEVPCPSKDDTVTAPLCACMISRTMASPSPVPCAAWSCALLAQK